jgi:hypothetical protein
MAAAGQGVWREPRGGFAQVIEAQSGGAAPASGNRRSFDSSCGAWIAKHRVRPPVVAPVRYEPAVCGRYSMASGAAIVLPVHRPHCYGKRSCCLHRRSAGAVLAGVAACAENRAAADVDLPSIDRWLLGIRGGPTDGSGRRSSAKMRSAANEKVSCSAGSSPFFVVGHAQSTSRQGADGSDAGFGRGAGARGSSSRSGHRYRFQASPAASPFWVDATRRNASRR